MKTISKNFYNVSHNNVKIIDSLDSPVIYKPSYFGISDQLKGNGVSIGIIDSGKPNHKDIANMSFSSITNSMIDDIKDNIGHATSIAGVIGSSSDTGITGIANKSDINFCKVINDNYTCNYNDIVTSLLWLAIKETDIIHIPFGSSFNFSLVSDAIKKITDMGIIVVVAEPKKDLIFPSSYPNVIVVGESSKKKGKVLINKNNVIEIPIGEGLITTYINNKFCKCSGSSMASALAVGLISLFIENKKKESKTKPDYKLVKEFLTGLSVKSKICN